MRGYERVRKGYEDDGRALRGTRGHKEGKVVSNWRNVDYDHKTKRFRGQRIRIL